MKEQQALTYFHEHSRGLFGSTSNFCITRLCRALTRLGGLVLLPSTSSMLLYSEVDCGCTIHYNSADLIVLCWI